MARLFPFKSETSPQEGQPRVVDLEGEDADAVFSALSSTTARRIYAQLDEEPGTPSDIADAVDSSIQNVRYHLENLEDAGLVEVVDTWYSSRGNEMSVYATTDGPLIVTSDESRASQLKEALSRLIGGIGALAGGSLLVQYGLTRWLAPGDAGSIASPEYGATDDSADAGAAGNGDGAGGADAADDDAATGGADEGAEGDAAEDGLDAADAESADGAARSEPEATDDSAPNGLEESADADRLSEGNDVAQNAADGGAETADAVLSTVPPGLLFFLGGLVVLLAVWVYWYWYRPTY